MLNTITTTTTTVGAASQQLNYDYIYDNPKIKKLISEYITKRPKSVYPTNEGMQINKSDLDPLKIKKAITQFRKLNKVFDLKNKKILEIGSGFGSLLLISRLNNVDIVGIEHDPNSVDMSTKLARILRIDDEIAIAGKGERLPFRDNTFDLIVSYQVLEHTDNPKQVISESVRVLKNKGYIYFICPNYHSFYEGHISKIWLPFLNKKNVKFYLKLLGFKKDRLDHIKFIKPKDILNYVKDLNVEIRSIGKKEFEEYFQEKNINKIQNRLLRIILHLILFLKINKALIKIINKFELHYPLVIFLKKNRKINFSN